MQPHELHAINNSTSFQLHAASIPMTPRNQALRSPEPITDRPSKPLFARLEQNELEGTHGCHVCETSPVDIPCYFPEAKGASFLAIGQALF
jgi:hypothetical protein